jgi:hypothetical protein
MSLLQCRGFFRFHSGKPATESASQIIDQNLYAGLQQHMRAAQGPACVFH